MELSDQESHDLEHYLQGNIHPEVAPLIRRAIKTDVFTFAGFLAAQDIIQLNHDAFDNDLLLQGVADASRAQQG